MKTYKDMNAAERLAFEIWDNSIAGQDMAELIANYTIYGNGAYCPEELFVKELTPRNVDEYYRELCWAVINNTPAIIAELQSVIDRAKETLLERNE